MVFDDRKRTFVQSRITRRLAAVGCSTPREYYRYLRYQDNSGEEFQNFVETLTTNETYFFREYPQLECFANHALPTILEAKRKAHDYRLRIWSAACSTGDEPYTLAIILKACLEDFHKWKIEILATDIDTNVLATAKNGVYSARAVKDVPKTYLQKYFQEDSNRYTLSEEIKKMVSFSQVNLFDRKSMRTFRRCDFIFCRNVLIYFDDESRRKVLSSFYDSLMPGRFIFLGHSESVGRISAAFEMISLGGRITYRRPLDKDNSNRVPTGGEACLTK